MTQLPPDEPPDEPPASPPLGESAGSPPPPPPPPPSDTPPAGWVPATTVPPPAAYLAPPAPSASDRVRTAWQARHGSDYIFDFWSALGWTVLSCGFYSFYVLFQLVRRDRDHIARRVELLDAATTFAWERAGAQGISEELRPAFERISTNMAVLRSQTTQFRDPIIWVILDFFTSGIARIVAYCLIDGDLVTHDHAEGAIEAELSEIYNRLGAATAAPDPMRLKGRHNYAARVIVTIVTCGIYGFWWLYDLMIEWNQHFEHNWRWEDSLAASVQSLLPNQVA